MCGLSPVVTRVERVYKRIEKDILTHTAHGMTTTVHYYQAPCRYTKNRLKNTLIIAYNSVELTVVFSLVRLGSGSSINNNW